jgi:hypothetical protein
MSRPKSPHFKIIDVIARAVVALSLGAITSAIGMALLWHYVYSIGSAAVADQFYDMYRVHLMICGSAIGIASGASLAHLSLKRSAIAIVLVQLASLGVGIALAYWSWRSAVATYVSVVMLGGASTALLACKGKHCNRRGAFTLLRAMILITTISVQLVVIRNCLLPMFRHEHALQQIESYGGVWGVVEEGDIARLVVVFSGREFGDSQLVAVTAAVAASRCNELRLNDTKVTGSGKERARHMLPSSIVITSRGKSRVDGR